MIKNKNKHNINISSNLKKLRDYFDCNSPVIASVVCLAFNHKEHISRCFDSILNQRVDFNVEIIVHDDCSTDGTKEMIDAYKRKYPHIFKTIVQKENQYSKGIDIVNEFINPLIDGRFVSFCECDDFWIDESHLFKKIHFLQRNNYYSACCSKTLQFDNKTNKKTFLATLKRDLEFPAKYIILDKIQRIHINTLVIRRQAYFAPRPPFYSLFVGHGDYPLLLFLVSAPNHLFFFSDLTSIYNMHSGSSSWTDNLYSDNNKFVKLKQGVIDGLVEYKKVSPQVLWPYIDDKILMSYYEIDCRIGKSPIDYKKYKKILRYYPKKSIFKKQIIQNFPFVYKFYRKFFKRKA